MIPYHIFILATGLTMSALGAIFFKIGATNIKNFQFTFTYIFHQIILNPYIFFGFLLYFIPAIIWIYLLNKYSISFLQPILALTYVITPILAILILKEQIPVLRRIGIAVIIVGVFIVSRS